MKNSERINKCSENLKPIKITILSNIVLEPHLKGLLGKAFDIHNLSIEVYSADYEELLRHANISGITDSQLVAVIPNFDYSWRNFIVDAHSDEIIWRELENTGRICSIIHENTSAIVVWFGYEDYCYELHRVLGNVPVEKMFIDKLNQQIYEFLRDDVIFIDMKKLVSEVGIPNAYDTRGRYRWNSPYSRSMVEVICNEICKQYLVSHMCTKKCLVLDCDNVLWGGILSEDGMDRVLLGSSGVGRRYQDFQRYLLFLYQHGVILAICSKNDLTDIMEMFRQHSDMVLKENHIALFQVNWNNKVDNIQRIAESLNIGLNSMIFIDDSDYEIQSVKQLLPSVSTMKFDYNTIYSDLSCLNLNQDADLKKINQRNFTYKTNQLRDSLRAESATYDDYLISLKTQIDIHLAKPIEYGRISELTLRTNRCTNGTRYNIEQLRKMNPEHRLYSVCVSDRFSDLGLVGAFEVYNNTLELFSLSCRALGRNIETQMLLCAIKQGATFFTYEETGKNGELKRLLMQHLKGPI